MPDSNRPAPPARVLARAAASPSSASMSPTSPYPTLARKLLAPLLLLALAGTAHAAQGLSCDELRTAIAAKLEAAGIRHFVLEAVDAGASAPGKVVGSCALGKRRIVYRAEPAAPASATEPAASAAHKLAAPAMITECRDGRVLTQGDCNN